MFNNIKLLKKLKRESTKIDYEFENINAKQEAVIRAKIRNVEEVISPFSCDEDLILTSSFENYLENVTSQIETQNPIFLKIDCKERLTDENKTKIKLAIRNHYTKKISLENENLRRNAIDSLFLFISSICVLALLIVLNLNNSFKIITEVLDILAWVLLWQVFENYIFVRRKLRGVAIDNYRILNMRIEFV